MRWASCRTVALAEMLTESLPMYLIEYMAVALDAEPAPRVSGTALHGLHDFCRLGPFGSLLRSLQLALERRIVDNLQELGKGFGVRVHADGDGLVGCVPVADVGTVLD